MSDSTKTIFEKLKENLKFLDDENFITDTYEYIKDDRKYIADIETANQFRRLTDIILVYLQRNHQLPQVSSNSIELYDASSYYSDDDSIFSMSFKTVLSQTGWEIEPEYCFSDNSILDIERAESLLKVTSEFSREYIYDEKEEDIVQQATDILERVCIYSIHNRMIDIIMDNYQCIKKRMPQLAEQFFNLQSEISNYIYNSTYVYTYCDKNGRHYICASEYFFDGWISYDSTNQEKYFAITLIPTFFELEQVCKQIMASMNLQAF